MEPLESPGDVIQYEVTEDQQDDDDVIFASEDEMRTSLSRLCYGDLYILGIIWIRALKTVLVGSKFCLFPVVQAAKPEEPPQRPPKMKYKELPIYKAPHSEYKDYIADKNACPERNTKILQKALLPHVTRWRKQARAINCEICCGMQSTYRDVATFIGNTKNEFKKTMRDPQNLKMRQGVLAGGTLFGFLAGGGGGIPRRAFFTGLGALAGGSLCFPKETDEIFREVSYHTAKWFLSMYNGLCGKNFQLRERVPCKDELPPEPKYRKPVCPPKKKK